MLCKSAPGARKAATRREEILAAATELFLNEGYGATSINKIILRAGGSKATIYAHFHDKEQLFGAVVDSIVDEAGDFIGAVEIESPDLREGLSAIGARLIEIAASPRHVALARLVIAESGRFPEIGRIYFERTPQRITALLADLIRSRVPSSKRALATPRELADLFSGMLLHHLLFARLCAGAEFPAPAKMKRMARQAAEIIAAAAEAKAPVVERSTR
jgi:AcrR family transcriptional regulator